MTKLSGGYRGYIGSRPYNGIDFPQYVQNFLIRSYCEKNGMTFLLSATEYQMQSCFMILEEVVSSVATLDGIVLFSMFMLPESIEKRKRIYQHVLAAGKSLHAALEDISIKNESDIQMVEDILRVNRIALTDQSAETVRELCAG